MGDIDWNKHKLVTAVVIGKSDRQVSSRCFVSQKNGIRCRAPDGRGEGTEGVSGRVEGE